MTANPSHWRLLLNRRMALFIFLGFSSGLPLFVLLSLLQAWLAGEGVTLDKIALLALVQFPYTWKFLWAPLIDRYSFPGRGRRRGWMIFTQAVCILAIAGFGSIDPHDHLVLVAALAGALAFFSASFDVAVDAFRREYLSDDELGPGTAIHVSAYKVAAFVPGGVSLILADHAAWSTVFEVTSAFMIPGFIVLWFIREAADRSLAPRSLTDAINLPLREFFHRSGWRGACLILLFIFLYKLGDAMSTSLSTVFYLGQGFTRTQIGLIAKSVGLTASIAGGVVAGAWMVTLGINRGLWVFGVLQMLSILGFAWLTTQGNDPTALALAIGVEAFASAGLGTTAFTAFIGRTTDVRFTATQYALFSGLASVPRTFATSAVGVLVNYFGWFEFFLVCALLAVPGLLLLPAVAPWNGVKR